MLVLYALVPTCVYACVRPVSVCAACISVCEACLSVLLRPCSLLSHLPPPLTFFLDSLNCFFFFSFKCVHGESWEVVWTRELGGGVDKRSEGAPSVAPPVAPPVALAPPLLLLTLSSGCIFLSLYLVSCSGHSIFLSSLSLSSLSFSSISFSLYLLLPTFLSMPLSLTVMWGGRVCVCGV